MVLTVNNYKTFYYILPLYGLGVQVGQFITYIHLMEVISPSKIAIVTGILFFLEGVCGYIFSPILLMLSKNADTLIYSCILLNISSLVLFFWSRPREGVKFYITHERFADAKEEARRIALFNGKSADLIVEAID